MLSCGRFRLTHPCTLLLLLCIGLAAMDARSEWRYCRAAQKYFQGLRDRFTTKSKIMINFGQVVTLFEKVYAVSFPVIFKDFLQKLSFFNIDFFRWVPIDCYADFNFYAGLVVSTLCFLAMVLLATVASTVKGRLIASDNTVAVALGKRANSLVTAGTLLAACIAVYACSVFIHC